MESIDFCHCFVHCWHLFDQWIDSRNKVPSFDNLFRHLPHSLFYKIIFKIKTYQFYMVDEKGDIWMWEHAAVLHEMGSHKCLAVGPRTLWQGCRNTDVLSEPLFKSRWWALTFLFSRDLRLLKGSLHFRRNFPSQYPRSVVGIDLSQEIKERNWRKTGCTSCVTNHKLLYFKYRVDQKKIH